VELDHTLMLFWKISLHRMCDHYLPKLLYALSLLNKEEIWVRETKESNSIGGIALHICEHVRRNMLEQQNRTMPFSRGIEEHFPQLDWTAKELGDYVQRTFVEWKNTMNRCINGHEKMNLDLFRLYHLVEHTSYHLGQIIDRIKQMKHVSFQFCQNGLSEKALREMVEKNVQSENF